MLSAITCKKSPLEPENTVNIILEDVTCTDALYRINIYGYSPPVNARVYLDNELINTLTLTTTDTLLELKKLLPKKAYSLQAEVYINGKPIRSNTLRFETMDTTSRNFTWEIYEFGDFGPSYLSDVAIIDENDIWAVGAINIADSSINGYTTYNAVHWDGTKWELKKIGGQGGWACHTVFAFSASDIWFEGNIHWNGSTYTANMNGWPLMPNGDGWQVNKMWGSSSEDLYAVGNNGNIAHWDGRKWTKIELKSSFGEGSNLTDLKDIYGTSENKRVFVNGYNTVSKHRSALIEIKNNEAEVLWYTEDLRWREPYGTTITNVYMSKDFLFLATTKGFFVKNIKYELLPKKVTDIGLDWVYSMRGNGYNDVFTFADYSEIYHYNGKNLRKLFSDYLTYNTLYGGTVKDRIIVGVGVRMVDAVTFKGRIVMGRRI